MQNKKIYRKTRKSKHNKRGLRRKSKRRQITRGGNGSSFMNEPTEFSEVPNPIKNKVYYYKINDIDSHYIAGILKEITPNNNLGPPKYTYNFDDKITTDIVYIPTTEKEKSMEGLITIHDLEPEKNPNLTDDYYFEFGLDEYNNTIYKKDKFLGMVEVRLHSQEFKSYYKIGNSKVTEIYRLKHEENSENRSV